MALIDVPCPWCTAPLTFEEGWMTLCPVCHHRADVPAAKCTCDVCRVRRANDSVLPPTCGTTHARTNGDEFRVGSLLTCVNELGINRILRDRDNPDFVIEIFESKQRAVEVFKKVWETLSLDEKAKLIADIGVMKWTG